MDYHEAKKKIVETLNLKGFVVEHNYKIKILHANLNFKSCDGSFRPDYTILNINITGENRLKAGLRNFNVLTGDYAKLIEKINKINFESQNIIDTKNKVSAQKSSQNEKVKKLLNGLQVMENSWNQKLEIPIINGYISDIRESNKGLSANLSLTIKKQFDNLNKEKIEELIKITDEFENKLEKIRCTK